MLLFEVLGFVTAKSLSITAFRGTTVDDVPVAKSVWQPEQEAPASRTHETHTVTRVTVAVAVWQWPRRMHLVALTADPQR